MAKLEIELYEPDEDSPNWWASTTYKDASYTAVGVTEEDALWNLKHLVEWGSREEA